MIQNKTKNITSNRHIENFIGVSNRTNSLGSVHDELEYFTVRFGSTHLLYELLDHDLNRLARELIKNTCKNKIIKS